MTTRVTARGWTALFFFATIAGIFFFAVVQPGINHLRPLVNQGRRTMGTIVSIDWDNHAVRVYEYEVDGKRYSSRMGLCSLDVGTRVPVVYLPSEPNHSVIGDPRQQRDTLVREASMLCPGYGLVAALLVWWRFPEAARRLQMAQQHRTSPRA